MKISGIRVVGGLAFVSLLVLGTGARVAAAEAAGEYARHFEALQKLSIAVAQAMPAKEYGFKPHPESKNPARDTSGVLGIEV